MNTRTRALSAVAAVSAIGLAMTGCSSDGGSDSDEPITLTYWSSQVGPDVPTTEAALNEQLVAFTADTGIEVDVETIPWSDLSTRILTAVSSGDSPDVTDIGNTMAVSLQATGAFVPFDDAGWDAIGGQEKFVASMVETGGAPDTDPTSVPMYGQAYSLYYNTELFAAAGIDEPSADWDEFVEQAQQLTIDTDGDGTIDQWGLGLPGGAARNAAHFAFIFGLQHGGTFFDEDFNPTLDTPEMADAVAQYVDLMSVSKVVSPADTEVLSVFDTMQDFINGDVAMMFPQGPLGTFEQAGFTDWGVTDVPVISPLPAGGESIQTPVLGSNISIFQDSEHIEAAQQLVAFLTDPEPQAALAAAFGVLPVAVDSYEIESFASEPSVAVRQRILAEHAAVYPLTPKASAVETAVGESVNRLLADFATTGNEITRADIEEALAGAQQTALSAG